MSAPRASRRAWNALPFSGNAPKSCFNHSCVVTSKSTLMLLGGETISNPTPLADHHLYRSRKWTLTTRHNAPIGLSAHSSVAWGAKMMIFGGRTSSGLSNEMHTYNEGTQHSHTQKHTHVLSILSRPPNLSSLSLPLHPLNPFQRFPPFFWRTSAQY